MRKIAVITSYVSAMLSWCRRKWDMGPFFQTKGSEVQTFYWISKWPFNTYKYSSAELYIPAWNTERYRSNVWLHWINVSFVSVSLSLHGFGFEQALIICAFKSSGLLSLRAFPLLRYWRSELAFWMMNGNTASPNAIIMFDHYLRRANLFLCAFLTIGLPREIERIHARKHVL